MQKKILVTQDNMLSVFAGGDIVHPYRFQPNVKIVVPYSEFKGFVQFLIQNGLRGVLNYDLDIYQKVINNGNEIGLRRFYLTEIASAVIREVCLAEVRGREGTTIVHSFGNLYDFVDMSTLSEYIRNYGTTEKEQERRTKAFASLVGTMPTVCTLSQVHGVNRVLYCYAISLWILALGENKMFEVT